MNEDFHKDSIYEGFFPQGKFAQPNFSTPQKAVENYERIAQSPTDLIDLMLYYVETGSEFMNEFDGIDEDVCIDLEDKFEVALKKIVEHNLKNEFEKRCREIAENANDGYGFSGSLQSNFERYFLP